MPHLLYLLPLLLSMACGGKDEPAKATCEGGCAVNQRCAEGGCACEAGFVDCDANPANGCEPASTCFCAYEGDAAFCERNGASCGEFAVADNCGNRRVVSCGTCTEGESCGAEEPNRCGAGICSPEGERRLCTDLGWLCGHGPATDRCGTLHDVQCGDCPAGTLCSPRRECIEDGLDRFSVCYGGGVPQGECAPHLECLGDEEYAICQQLCRADGDCPIGESCAIGFVDEGIGICGNLRGMSESCVWADEGPDFCWDPAHPEMRFYCLSERCRYVCAFEGEANSPCPEGSACSANFVFSEDLQRNVKVCVAF